MKRKNPTKAMIAFYRAAEARMRAQARADRATKRAMEAGLHTGYHATKEGKVTWFWVSAETFTQPGLREKVHLYVNNGQACMFAMLSKTVGLAEQGA